MNVKLKHEVELHSKNNTAHCVYLESRYLTSYSKIKSPAGSSELDDGDTCNTFPLSQPWSPHTGRDPVTLLFKWQTGGHAPTRHLRGIRAAAAAVMIDKSGNGDTYSELLSGRGSAEMKSDGLSLGRRVTAARTRAAGKRRGSSPPRTAEWQLAAWRRLLSVSGINRGPARNEIVPPGWRRVRRSRRLSEPFSLRRPRLESRGDRPRRPPPFEAIYLSARRWITGEGNGRRRRMGTSTSIWGLGGGIEIHGPRLHRVQIAL